MLFKDIKYKVMMKTYYKDTTRYDHKWLSTLEEAHAFIEEDHNKYKETYCHRLYGIYMPSYFGKSHDDILETYDFDELPLIYARGLDNVLRPNKYEMTDENSD